MGEFEKKDYKENKEHEEWKRSDGELRKKDSLDERGDRYDRGEKKLTGYAPSVKEKSTGNAPREIARMESSYGAVSIGVSRKKEVTLAISEKRRHNAPVIAKAQKEVDGNKMVARRKSYFYNNDAQEKGASVYRKKSDVSSNRMQRGLRGMIKRLNSETAERTVPFFAPERTINKQKRPDGLNREKIKQEQARQKNLENRLINELYSSLEKGNKKISAELSEVPVYFQYQSSVNLEDGSEENTENTENNTDNKKKNKNVQ